MQEIELKPQLKPEKHKQIHVFCDLDGVLAEYSDWDAQQNNIGKPIKKMINNVKSWLKKKYLVTIFTARLSHGAVESEQQIALIQQFLRDNGLPDTLPISCIKGWWMTHQIDDRAYHSPKNSGLIEGNPDL